MPTCLLGKGAPDQPQGSGYVTLIIVQVCALTVDSSNQSTYNFILQIVGDIFPISCFNCPHTCPQY